MMIVAALTAFGVQNAMTTGNFVTQVLANEMCWRAITELVSDMGTALTVIPLPKTTAGGAHLTPLQIDRTITVFPNLDLARTIPAVRLTPTGFALPCAIFLLHGYIAGLPGDICESALVDGADRLAASGVAYRRGQAASEPIAGLHTHRHGGSNDDVLDPAAIPSSEGSWPVP